MRTNPGKVMTIYDIPGIVATALPLATTLTNVQAGFRNSGICPFNRQIFSELDFAPSYVTDRPNPNDLQINNGDLPILQELGNQQANSSGAPNPEMLPIRPPQRFLRDSVLPPSCSSAVPVSEILINLPNPMTPQINPCTILEAFIPFSTEDSVTLQSSASALPEAGVQITQTISSPLKPHHGTELETVVSNYPQGSVTSPPSSSFAFVQDIFTNLTSPIVPPLNSASIPNDFVIQYPVSSVTLQLKKSELGIQTAITTSTISQPNSADALKEVTSCFSLSNLLVSRQPIDTETDPLAIPEPLTNTFTPECVRPFPKAAPRKTTKNTMKRKSTVYMDTPEKENIRIQTEERNRKKNTTKVKYNMKNMKEKKEKTNKRNTKAKKKPRNTNSRIFSSSEDEERVSSDEDGDFELPQYPESVYDISEDLGQFDSSSCESVNEDASTSLRIEDWAIINLTSMKNLVHRYVGQIKDITKHGYVVKFAKNLDNHKFKWPVKEDLSEISKYQVVKKINPPDVKSNSRRVIMFEFMKSLRKFKIE